MTHLDLFSGIGGFTLAFARHGFTTVAFAEIEPFACRVLAQRWPSVPNLGSVCDLEGADLRARFGHITVVTFGSPCQDLSVAGKRAGLGGERSSLFHEAIRIICYLRPTFAVWENVPGAFSSQRGWDFGAVLDSLAECGALDIAWRVLDAQYAGVPQRRDRIFVVADFGGERAGEILSLTEGVRGHSAASSEAGQDVAGTLGGGAGSRGWAPDTDRMTFVAQCHGTNVGEIGALRKGNGGVTGGVPFVAHATGAGYWNEGAGTLRARGQESHEHLVTHALRADGFDASEDGTGRGTPLVPVAFDQHYAPDSITPPLIAGEGGGGKNEFNSPIVLAQNGSDIQVNDGKTVGALDCGYERQTSGDLVAVIEQNTQCSTPPLPSLRAHETPNYGILAFSTKESGRDVGPVAPPLRAESGDPHMGGRTAVAFPIHSDADRGDSSARTPSPDAEGIVRLRDPGIGIGAEGDPMFTLQATKPHAVAFDTRNQSVSEKAQTLTDPNGTFGDALPAVHGNFGVRRLTPTECEALMGFPRGWTNVSDAKGKPAADGPRYRVLGNAVVPCVVGQIAERMAQSAREAKAA